MKNWSVPMSLCLLCLLTACATKRVVISDPEVIESQSLSCPTIPVHLLRPCAVLALPFFGITWADTIEVIKLKDLEQKTCNERFGIISQWQTDNIVGN